MSGRSGKIADIELDAWQSEDQRINKCIQWFIQRSELGEKGRNLSAIEKNRKEERGTNPENDS